MKQLMVIRHGIAVDKEEFASSGRSDDERPLTEDGLREMRRVARGLHSLVSRIDLLASSPLVRAKQTAEAVADEYGISVGEIIEPLRPKSDFTAFTAWLDATRRSDIVAVVGHDPHLSRLVTWLATGVDSAHVALEKGGACLLHFDSSIGAAKATIDWLLMPAQLAVLSRHEKTAMPTS